MSIVDKIRDAGIVGCGGAGFPTHAKLKGKIEYLIINGAECEPLLRTDRYIMRNYAPNLVKALVAMKEELGIENVVIALKEHYHDETKALRAAIAAVNAPIRLHLMESFYPAGDEQTIVYEVTGRVVPPAGIPIAVGAVVNNVATVYAISQAMENIPLTQKILTVTGEVKKPTVLCVPVGTSYRKCIELAGGTNSSTYFVVSGGPMMGKPMTMEDADHAVVTKTTSGILVLPADGYHANTYRIELKRMLKQASVACIQCTNCTQLCPRHMLGHPLRPHMIMRKMAVAGDIQQMLNDPDIRNAQLCCECGICETYACPMGLFPRKINAMLKGELGKAGIRYQAPAQEWTASPLRSGRKAPSDKVAARVGVRKYYNYEITDIITASADRVEIPVKMHIGAPSVAMVSVGDFVRAGQVIAQPPEGALGANIHASIDGRVTAVGERIVIEKE